jgi:hypothetical protein
MMTWSPNDPKDKDKDLKPAIEKKQVHLDDGKGWNSGGDRWDKQTRRDKFDSVRDDTIDALVKDGKFTGNKVPYTVADLLDWSWRMWVWGRRVRRDMLVLEMQLDAITGSKIPKFDDPGDPPPPPDLETL